MPVFCAVFLFLRSVVEIHFQEGIFDFGGLSWSCVYVFFCFCFVHQTCFETIFFMSGLPFGFVRSVFRFVSTPFVCVYFEKEDEVVTGHHTPCAFLVSFPVPFLSRHSCVYARFGRASFLFFSLSGGATLGPAHFSDSLGTCGVCVCSTPLRPFSRTRGGKVGFIVFPLLFFVFPFC